MTKKYSQPRGTNDILPAEIPLWLALEETSRNILNRYGYREIRTPSFEETALFVRSLGQTSDVVQKQMLNLATEKQDGLSLRPEGTAAIVRSYIENDIDKKWQLAKLFYIGPMYRGERPQKGRLRQFHQIGVEAIGISNPYLDADVISLSARLLEGFGISDYKIKINTLGSPQDKENFSKHLRQQLKPSLSKLCEDCQQRFERNVFRILDCKVEGCRAVVQSLDLGQSHLSQESKDYFNQVKEALTALQVSFEVSPFLVRGLDYYTHTAFEISHESLGSQDAIGAGGRYDNLVEELGGAKAGAIGFALGIERILIVKSQGVELTDPKIDSFIVTMGDAAYKKGFLLLNEIRKSSVSCEMNYEKASVKSQMRLADKYGARLVIILGDDELKDNMVVLKDMRTGTQEKISISSIFDIIRTKLSAR